MTRAAPTKLKTNEATAKLTENRVRDIRDSRMGAFEKTVAFPRTPRPDARFDQQAANIPTISANTKRRPPDCNPAPKIQSNSAMAPGIWDASTLNYPPAPSASVGRA